METDHCRIRKTETKMAVKIRKQSEYHGEVTRASLDERLFFPVPGTIGY